MEARENARHYTEMSRREFLGLGSAAGAGLLLAGCSAASGSNGDKLTIAVQPGYVGFAQLIIMKHERWLDKELPNLEISWTELASGSAVRKAMLAGEVQVGSGGIGPFLVGYDADVGWKILSNIVDVDLWLMVNDDKYQSLEDFGPDDKIGLPAPDSIQAIVLRKGAEEQLGDPGALDQNMVSLEEPDSMQSLMSGQLAAHLAGIPYKDQEADRGARPILKSYELFGEQHSSTSVWAIQDYHDQNPKVMKAIYGGMERATRLIREDVGKAAKILSDESGGEWSPKEFERYMTGKGTEYTIEPHGFMPFAEFMASAGLIEQKPASWKALVYDNLKHTNGS